MLMFTSIFHIVRGNMFLLVDARVAARQTVKKLAASSGKNSTISILPASDDFLYQSVLTRENALVQLGKQQRSAVCVKDTPLHWKCVSVNLGSAGSICNSSSVGSNIVRRCAVDVAGAVASMQVLYQQAILMGTFNSSICIKNYMGLCAAFGGTLRSEDQYNRCSQQVECQSTFADQVGPFPLQIFCSRIFPRFHENARAR
jgi:hypothetical protein